MGTQVQHSAFVHFSGLSISVEVTLVVHNKLVDSFHHVDLFHLLLEFLSAQVWKSDQQVHEHADFHWLSNEFKNAIHDMGGLFRFVSQVYLTPFRMDDICKHGCCEVQAEHVYFDCEWGLDQLEHPVYDIIVQVSANNCFFDWALLEDC